MGCLLVHLLPLMPNTVFCLFTLSFLSHFSFLSSCFVGLASRLFGCSYGSIHLFLDVHYLFYCPLSLFLTSVHTSLPQYYSFFTGAFSCHLISAWLYSAYFSWPNLVFGHISGC